MPALDTDGEKPANRARQPADQRAPGGAGAARSRTRRSSAGAPVTLATGRLADRRVAISIRDRGIGIGADDLPRVFDPYFTTRRTGTGLGLPIAKNIIDGARRHHRRGQHAGRRHRHPHRARRRARPEPVMTPAGSILLADDEEKILKTLGRALREEGHDVVTTPSALEAQRLLVERSFDLLVIDYLMPERTGLEVIRELVATTPEGERPAMVMMTAHGTVESAVEAMKLGARDYLQKPFDVDELLVTVRRLLEEQRTRTGLRYLLSERDAEFNHYGLVGRSRAVLDVIQRAELVAESRSTVLVTGETGTGKELVARAIHARSAQRDMPLIKVNCAAIPETLLESELFGHVRGAFTGATFTKKGRFALADGGTIFLDEIGTISIAVQAKLLRVLQEREFEPLGAERTQKVDVRVIAATNRDLRADGAPRAGSRRICTTGST